MTLTSTPNPRNRYVPRQVVGAFHYALFEHVIRILQKGARKGNATRVVDCTAGSANFELASYADTVEVVDTFKDLRTVLEKHDQPGTIVVVFSPSFLGGEKVQKAFIRSFMSKRWKSRVWFVHVEPSLRAFRREMEHWTVVGELFTHPFFLWDRKTLDCGFVPMSESESLFRPDRHYAKGFQSEHWKAADPSHPAHEFGVTSDDASRTGRHVHEGPGRADEGLSPEAQRAGVEGGGAESR